MSLALPFWGAALDITRSYNSWRQREFCLFGWEAGLQAKLGLKVCFLFCDFSNPGSLTDRHHPLHRHTHSKPLFIQKLTAVFLGFDDPSSLRSGDPFPPFPCSLTSCVPVPYRLANWDCEAGPQAMGKDQVITWVKMKTNGLLISVCSHLCSLSIPSLPKNKVCFV